MSRVVCDISLVLNNEEKISYVSIFIVIFKVSYDCNTEYEKHRNLIQNVHTKNGIQD